MLTGEPQPVAQGLDGSPRIAGSERRATHPDVHGGLQCRRHLRRPNAVDVDGARSKSAEKLDVAHFGHPARAVSNLRRRPAGSKRDERRGTSAGAAVLRCWYDRRSASLRIAGSALVGDRSCSGIPGPARQRFEAPATLGQPLLEHGHLIAQLAQL